jgi:predicted amino acid racemase
MTDHGADWTLVTKVLCGHTPTLDALQTIGVRSMADSRLDNIRAINRVIDDFESWYLRLPHVTAIPEIIRLTDASLNSEVAIIKQLNEEAKKQDKIHRVIVMIELGDLREGVLPGKLTDFYKDIFELSNIEILGIGANLGCLSGAVPSVDQLTQLVLYHELLELKFERKLPLISAGTSATLPILLDGKVPKKINHFRIGDSVYTGVDLLGGGTLPGLRDDAFTLDAEIVEIREKSLVPFGETSTIAPFGLEMADDAGPGQRGYRAVLTMGALDTEVSGLTPLDPSHKIAGVSSDVMVINIGEERGSLKIGDSIKFRPNYAALLRLMASKYIDKKVVPTVEELGENMDDDDEVNVLPVFGNDEEQES